MIDNNFLIKKSNFNKCKFDENYFLYFETLDFCSSLKNGEIIRLKKYKISSFGSNRYLGINNLVRKTRSFHYMWSKFYFYKKNYNFLFALRKTIPNLIKSIKKIIINFLSLNFLEVKYNFLELFGLICSIININSFYRPKN